MISQPAGQRENTRIGTRAVLAVALAWLPAALAGAACRADETVAFVEQLDSWTSQQWHTQSVGDATTQPAACSCRAIVINIVSGSFASS